MDMLEANFGVITVTEAKGWSVHQEEASLAFKVYA